ncbi:MAG: cytochrome P450 [Methylococcaceae bacterium]|nr:cytochrome P450 [Methylococcaceae bacterium]
MAIKAGDTSRDARSRKPYRLLSISVSPYCELVRWVLEKASVPYQETCSVPVLHFFANKCKGGGIDVPLFISNEVTLTEARQTIEYIDSRVPPALMLYPSDSALNTETQRLLDVFFAKLITSVSSFSYSYCLPEKALLMPVITYKAPSWQTCLVDRFYSKFRARMEQSLPAGMHLIDGFRKTIEEVFTEVDGLLKDGRPFLLGDQLTIADISFAAMTGPLLAPNNYGSPLPDPLRIPEPMRVFAESLRSRPAGRHALKLYREHRPRPQLEIDHHPASTTPESRLSYLKSRLIACATGSPVQLKVFAWLRKHKPVCMLGKTVIISRDADVREALARNTEFTIAEINAPNMLRLNGPFFLGMDASETYTREQGDTRKVIKPDESQLITAIAKKHCQALVNAALPIGRIDMVSNLARPAAARFIAEYFGVPGQSETRLMYWMRSLFYDLFINLNNDRSIQISAEIAFRELGPYLLDLIAERRKLAKKGQVGADFLSRMVDMQVKKQISLDDDGIRRNISGLIVGALDTTNKVSTSVVNLLLDHPDWLSQAKAVVDDEIAFRHLCFDVLRFDTMATVMRRYARNDIDIAGVRIPQGSNVFVATGSAMFDESAFPDPQSIKTDRPLDRYLHFGDGMHRCFGEYVNRIQVPIIVGSVVRLPNVRKHSTLLFDGPFPDQFVLAFDAQPAK